MTLPAIAVALLMQAADAPVSIFVGPNVRDGFVDTDQGVQDSIEDLRQELRKNTALRIVTDVGSARLRLLVTERRRFNTGSSVATGVGTSAGGVSSGSAVSIALEGYRVGALLRVGDYQRTLVGESQSRWRGCAESISKDLGVWLRANHERLAAAQ